MSQDEDFQAEHASHPWGIFFTVLGTVLLDFDADACQSPSRAYLLDVTLPGRTKKVPLFKNEQHYVFKVIGACCDQLHSSKLSFLLVLFFLEATSPNDYGSTTWFAVTGPLHEKDNELQYYFPWIDTKHVNSRS